MENSTKKGKSLHDIVSDVNINGKKETPSDYAAQTRHLKNILKFLKLPETLTLKEHGAYLIKDSEEEIKTMIRLKTSPKVKALTQKGKLELRLLNVDDISKSDNEELFEFVKATYDFLNKNNIWVFVDETMQDVLRLLIEFYPLYKKMTDTRFSLAMMMQNMSDKNKHTSFTFYHYTRLLKDIEHLYTEIQEKIDNFNESFNDNE